MKTILMIAAATIPVGMVAFLVFRHGRRLRCKYCSSSEVHYPVQMDGRDQWVCQSCIYRHQRGDR